MRAGIVGGAVPEAVAALRAAVDALTSCDLESLDAAERVELLADLETHRCRIPALEHRLINALDADTPPAQLGAKSLADALQTRLNLHPREAKRRVAVAADLGPRRSLTGQPMPPTLPATAIAVSHEVINADHVTVIRDAVAKIPTHVDPMQRSGLEVAWARAAMSMAPHQLAADLTRALYLLDQDGPPPTDEDGAASRRDRRQAGGRWHRRGERGDDRRGLGRPGSPVGEVRRPRHVQPPPTMSPVRRGHRAKRRSTPMTARWPSVATTRWRSSTARPWPRVNWAGSTGFPRRS